MLGLGCKNSLLRRLNFMQYNFKAGVAGATKLLTVTTDTFSITISGVFRCMQTCVSAHMHREESALQHLGLQVTPELWVLRMELILCHPSGADNL
jgi:hypothetical protein